jgi:ribosomal-protein-alanine N-acetyltransferase
VNEYSFRSERLGMRPWRASDLAAFYAIFGDERVIWWGKHQTSQAQARADLERVIAEQDSPDRGLGRFAVVHRRSSAVVGNVILRPAGFDAGIEVGYHIAHAAWGLGHATEAARAALQYGFEVIGLTRIVAAVALRNSASLRVMQKLAMLPTHEAEVLGLPHRMFERWR